MNRRCFIVQVAICFFMLVPIQAQDKPSDLAGDKVYKGNEVDKKAVITKTRFDEEGPTPSGCKGKGLVTIGAVLRKTGKVTNITVFESGPCAKFEQRAIKTVQKIKFKPAVKDGMPVSMYYNFEFSYDCHGGCP